jgi:hypothetical protein
VLFVVKKASFADDHRLAKRLFTHCAERRFCKILGFLVQFNLIAPFLNHLTSFGDASAVVAHFY